MLAHASTIFHPSGTCTMAPASNPMALVDRELRVHDLEALRVADASIMPTVVSGNTNAACIMIRRDMRGDDARSAVSTGDWRRQ
jgi:choline dehydrogenase